MDVARYRMICLVLTKLGVQVTDNVIRKKCVQVQSRYVALSCLLYLEFIGIDFMKRSLKLKVFIEKSTLVYIHDIASFKN